MSREEGQDASSEPGNEMSADQVADLTRDLLFDLYDDQLLNDCHQKLLAGHVVDAMEQLEAGLNEMFLDSSDPEWKSFVQFCLAHPIREVLHQDPFTRRAFEKPRGYPGDPVLLDFIYGVEQGNGSPEDTSELGRQIFEYITRSSLCDGLRGQTRTVAEAVDRLAGHVQRPQVLSVVGGHVREVGISEAVKQKRIGRWVALDSDAESLEEVRRSYGAQEVETLAGTVRQLLAGKLELMDFDFVYSTRLYGYLEQSTGQRLTARLFEMLRPEGQLLVTNFAPEIRERGYMESFMDWQLTYRSPAEMLDLAAGIDPTQVSEARLLTEDHQSAEDRENVVLLRITKK